MTRSEYWTWFQNAQKTSEMVKLECVSLLGWPSYIFLCFNYSSLTFSTLENIVYLCLFYICFNIFLHSSSLPSHPFLPKNPWFLWPLSIDHQSLCIFASGGESWGFIMKNKVFVDPMPCQSKRNGWFLSPYYIYTYIYILYIYIYILYT